MGQCGNKLKYNCGDRRMNARCVFYDLPIPEFSKLSEEDCVVLEETTEDLYKWTDWIKESIDLEDFDDKCLDIDKVKDSYDKKKSRYLVKDVLQSLTEKVCELSNDGNTSETGSGDGLPFSLDFKCLAGECDTRPGNMQQLLQMIIDKICENG